MLTHLSIEYCREVERLQEQNKSLEKDLQHFKDLSFSLDKERKEAIERATQLGDQVHAQQQRINEIEVKSAELQHVNENAQNKIDELQQNLVKEKRRREYLQEEKDRVDRALKEIVSIHQDLVQHKSGMIAADAEASIPRKSSSIGKKRRQSVGRGRISGRKSALKNNRSYSPVKVSFNRSGSKSKSTNPKTSLSSLQRRLRRANLNNNVPFINGPTTNSYNVNVAVQRQLNVGNEYEKRPEEEPYKYYTDPSLLDDIDPNKEIGAVIDELSDEYSNLDRKYNDLLTKIASTNDDNVHVTSELKKVLDMMDRKGQQLQYLRHYHKMVVDRIREATSPPRVRGAAKRIRALRLFKDLRTLTSTKDIMQ